MERQSNFELLRILCMMYIVMHHFITHALPLSYLYVPSVGIEWDLTQILNAFCFCAVNVFIIISGYFGIHPKFRSFFNLYLMCAFYIFVLYHLHLYEIGSHINRWSILYTIMPFSYNPGWWFIMCYVMLYILSPILNASINSFDKKQFIHALVLLTIVNMYFGFYRNQDFANYGYSISHFIYMYFIGAFIGKYFDSKRIKEWRWKLFVTYFVGSLVLGGMKIMNARYLYNDTSVWLYTLNYNHPLLIVNSIALFMFFETLTFRCRVVNYIAPSVLAVYLLHECKWFSSSYYHFICSQWETQQTPALRIGILFIMCILVFALCVAIDQIRRFVTCPIVKSAEKYYKICKQRVLKNESSIDSHTGV